MLKPIPGSIKSGTVSLIGSPSLTKALGLVATQDTVAWASVDSVGIPALGQVASAGSQQQALVRAVTAATPGRVVIPGIAVLGKVDFQVLAERVAAAIQASVPPPVSADTVRSADTVDTAL